MSVSGDINWSHSDSSCTNVSQPASDKNYWEGIKINIGNPRSSKYVTTMEIDRGPHTHRKQALTSRFNCYRKFAESLPKLGRSLCAVTGRPAHGTNTITTRNRRTKWPSRSRR